MSCGCSIRRSPTGNANEETIIHCQKHASMDSIIDEKELTIIGLRRRSLAAIVSLRGMKKLTAANKKLAEEAISALESE